MIGQIARREIQHNLYSIRFPALIIISAALFTFNAVTAVTEPAREIIEPSASAVRMTIASQNSELEFCVRGTSADRDLRMDMRIGGFIEPEIAYDQSGLPEGDYLASFAIGHIDHIDWVFIIKIIFSLFAIIFTFDAICWERERGTLALVSANPVPRSSILLGKYLGACGTLLMPLVMAITLNLTIILIAGGIAGTISLQTEHWFRIGLLVVVSIVHISLFVLLGLLVSTIMKRRSSSLLILLAIWVALVIVLPNLAGIVAEHGSKAKSGYQISLAWRQVSNPVVVAELDKQIASGKIRTEEELHRAAEETYIRMQEIVNDMYSQHQNALIAKRRYARRIAMASPAAIYQYVSEVIADSGFERQQRFLRSVKDYYLTYEDYVRSKIGRIIPWCSSQFSTPMRFGEKWVRISSPMPKEYKGDMSDFPRFSDPPWTVTDSLHLSLSSLAVLFLWCILLFVAAHYIFVKRSLR